MAFGPRIFDNKKYPLIKTSLSAFVIDNSGMVRNSAKEAISSLVALSDDPQRVRKEIKDSLPRAFKNREITPTKKNLGATLTPGKGSGHYSHVYTKKRRVKVLPLDKKIDTLIRTEEFVKENGKLRPRNLPKVDISDIEEEKSRKKVIELSKKKLLNRKKRSLTYKNYPELESLEQIF